MTRLQSPKTNLCRYTVWLLIAIVSFLFNSCQFEGNEISYPTEFQFPQEWIGNWNGELKIYDHSGIKQSLPMGLQIHPTDNPGTYSWIIQYGDDTLTGKRDYLIKAINDTLGHYQIDEKNSIFIDAYLINDQLLSRFEIMGNKIHSSYKRQRDEIVVEIIISNSSDTLTSGGSIVNGDTIPQVFSFPISGVQKAILVREK